MICQSLRPAEVTGSAARSQQQQNKHTCFRTNIYWSLACLFNEQLSPPRVQVRVGCHSNSISLSTGHWSGDAGSSLILFSRNSFSGLWILSSRKIQLITCSIYCRYFSWSANQEKYLFCSLVFMRVYAREQRQLFSCHRHRYTHFLCTLYRRLSSLKSPGGIEVPLKGPSARIIIIRHFLFLSLLLCS